MRLKSSTLFAVTDRMSLEATGSQSYELNQQMSLPQTLTWHAPPRTLMAMRSKDSMATTRGPRCLSPCCGEANFSGLSWSGLAAQQLHAQVSMTMSKMPCWMHIVAGRRAQMSYLLKPESSPERRGACIASTVSYKYELSAVGSDGGLQKRGHVFSQSYPTTHQKKMCSKDNAGAHIIGCEV